MCLLVHINKWFITCLKSIDSLLSNFSSDKMVSKSWGVVLEIVFLIDPEVFSASVVRMLANKLFSFFVINHSTIGVGFNVGAKHIGASNWSLIDWYLKTMFTLKYNNCTINIEDD